MPIDTSIYGQQRQFQMESPYESATKAMQFRQAQKQYRLDDAVEIAGRDSGGDPEKMAQALMAQGHYEPALKLRGQAQTQKRADVEQKLKLAEAAGSDSMALDTVWRQALQESNGDQTAALQRVEPIYQQTRAKWAQLGHQLPDRFDPDANFAGIGNAKEAVQYLKSLAPDIVMTDTGGSMTPVNRNPLAGKVGPYAGGESIPKTPAPQAAPNSVREYEYAVKQGYKGTYEQFELAQRRAGASNVTAVAGGPMTPGKAGATKIDEDMLGATKGLMQLDTINSQFKPEYQRFMDKAGYTALKVKDSTVGLTNKEKADLTAYSQYRRNAVNSLNEYIKSITGAAMSEAEAQRILNGMPKIGDGWFDGDSPTEFKAKLDDAMAQTKKSIARLAYLKRNGMSLEDGLGKGVTLDRMPELMKERGREIEAELKKTAPNASKEVVGRSMRRQLSVEFGLSAD
jgi:hypothetical protein